MKGGNIFMASGALIFHADLFYWIIRCKLKSIVLREEKRSTGYEGAVRILINLKEWR